MLKKNQRRRNKAAAVSGAQKLVIEDVGGKVDALAVLKDALNKDASGEGRRGEVNFGCHLGGSADDNHDVRFEDDGRSTCEDDGEKEGVAGAHAELAAVDRSPALGAEGGGVRVEEVEGVTHSSYNATKKRKKKDARLRDLKANV